MLNESPQLMQKPFCNYSYQMQERIAFYVRTQSQDKIGELFHWAEALRTLNPHIKSYPSFSADMIVDVEVLVRSNLK